MRLGHNRTSIDRIDRYSEREHRMQRKVNYKCPPKPKHIQQRGEMCAIRNKCVFPFFCRHQLLGTREVAAVWWPVTVSGVKKIKRNWKDKQGKMKILRPMLQRDE